MKHNASNLSTMSGVRLHKLRRKDKTKIQDCQTFGPEFSRNRQKTPSCDSSLSTNAPTRTLLYITRCLTHREAIPALGHEVILRPNVPKFIRFGRGISYSLAKCAENLEIWPKNTCMLQKIFLSLRSRTVKHII